MSHITIAINAGVVGGASGGVFQATHSLIRALGELEGPERYLLLAGGRDQADWLQNCIGPNQQIVIRGKRSGSGGTIRYHEYPGSGGRVRQVIRPAFSRIRALLGFFVPQFPRLPMSDGFVESLGCDVLHFPTQGFAVSAIPTVFNPHDLQHLHYPEFWDPWEITRREIVYRAGCVFSAAVVVGSRWAREDISRQYAIDPKKVHVIPEGAPSGYPRDSPECTRSEVGQRHGLPPSYAFYPANMWPHKNHLTLLEALLQLRQSKGIEIPLICTGSLQGGAWPAVERRTRQLGLNGQVKYLGFVSEGDLKAIHEGAMFMVQPSLFEASSLPMFDSWHHGVPVAAANVTALPEQAGDAAILFDPRDPSSIADAMETLWSDLIVREELRSRGYVRIQRFDWKTSAKTYRATYRRAGRVSLCDEDRELLAVESL